MPPAPPDPTLPLPDNAVVVRFGGQNTDWVGKAREQATESSADPDVGRFELSTWCAIPLDESPEEIEAAIHLACEAAPFSYSLIRVATASELRDEGLDLDWKEAQADGSPLHWNIPLASADEADKAVGVFGDTKRNPGKKRRAR